MGCCPHDLEPSPSNPFASLNSTHMLLHLNYPALMASLTSRSRSALPRTFAAAISAITPAFTDAFLPKFFASLGRSNPLPHGVNRWDEPLNGRTPVILIHGTWLNAYNTWDFIARDLIESGHAVFACNYGKARGTFVGRAPGVYGNNFLKESQLEVAAFIDEVLERTGASQVDLVGHSQGVAQCRLYLTDSGGYSFRDDANSSTSSKVRRIVGVGPAHHGTTLSGVGTLGDKLDPGHKLDAQLHHILGGATTDQRKGDPFSEHLNRYGDALEGVDYTMILARYDGIATPWREQVMAVPGGERRGAHVRNILAQDCGHPLDLSGHLSMLYSPRVSSLVRQALSGTDQPLKAESMKAKAPRPIVLPLLGALGRAR